LGRDQAEAQHGSSAKEKTQMSYGLLISFPDQSESFVHGWEAGALYRQMQAELGPIETMIHTENKEIVTRICGSLSWAVEFEATELAEWTKATLSRSRRPALHIV
jgi:hypothetical protein